MSGSGCQLVHCYSDAVMLLDHDIPRTREVRQLRSQLREQKLTWVENQMGSSVLDLSVAASLPVPPRKSAGKVFTNKTGKKMTLRHGLNYPRGSQQRKKYHAGVATSP